MTSIDILNKIHCELLVKNVRQAWLIQSCDYNFDSCTISFILDYINNNYSDLKVTKLDDNYFVTKIESDIDIIKSRLEMTKDEFEIYIGKLLGFTCTNVSPKSSYSITYYKTERTNDSCCFSITFIPYELLAFNCSCDNCDTMVEYLRYQIENAIISIPEFSKVESNVILQKNKHISVDFLIDKLITTPTELTIEEHWETANYLYNLGFSDRLHKLAMNSTFQYSNPKHIGILLTLLTHYKHNYLEPFCPLQHSGKMEEVKKITTEWERSIIGILEKTTNPNV